MTSSTACVICLDIIETFAYTNCNHPFHLGCIVSWTNVNPTCPLCKAAINRITHRGGQVNPPAPNKANKIQIVEEPVLTCQLCTLECCLSQIEELSPCMMSCGEHIHIACATARAISPSRWSCKDCVDLREHHIQEQVLRSQIDLQCRQRSSARSLKPGYSSPSSGSGGVCFVKVENNDEGTSCDGVDNSSAACWSQGSERKTIRDVIASAASFSQTHRDVWKDYLLAVNRQNEKIVRQPSSSSSSRSSSSSSSNDRKMMVASVSDSVADLVPSLNHCQTGRMFAESVSSVSSASKRSYYCTDIKDASSSGSASAKSSSSVAKRPPTKRPKSNLAAQIMEELNANH